MIYIYIYFNVFCIEEGGDHCCQSLAPLLCHGDVQVREATQQRMIRYGHYMRQLTTVASVFWYLWHFVIQYILYYLIMTTVCIRHSNQWSMIVIWVSWVHHCEQWQSINIKLSSVFHIVIPGKSIEKIWNVIRFQSESFECPKSAQNYLLSLSLSPACKGHTKKEFGCKVHQYFNVHRHDG